MRIETDVTEPCTISVKDVADIIHSYGRDLAGYGLKPEYGDDTVYGDFRIQIYPDGQWSYHTGDSSYDQDHRGAWGSCSVKVRITRKEAHDLAVDILGSIE